MKPLLSTYLSWLKVDTWNVRLLDDVWDGIVFLQAAGILIDVLFCSRAGAHSFDPFMARGRNERMVMMVCEVGRQREITICQLPHHVFKVP